MQIVLRSNLFKRVALLLALAAFLALVVWVSRTYVAELVARKPSVQNLQVAARLDPSNSDYQLRLGRLFQYSLTDINPGRAVGHLKRATELDPYDPQPWLDLGAALEFQGKTAEAEASLRRADFLAPNIPAAQWAIGNFFLLHGNVDEAFRHFKVVLAGSLQYNQVLYNMAWKASGDASKILEQLIPNSVGTEFDYLYYLLSRQRLAEARSVWKRIAGSSEKFAPSQAAGYIDSLIAAHRPGEAYQVWNALQNKGLIRATDLETSHNLLLNGDFEEELLNMGFDWRIIPTAGAYAGLDQSTFHSPSHALLIQFSGKENLFYRNVLQFVRVAPGRSYRLRGFMKTEGITTDSGPRLEVRDAYELRALDKFSEDVRGDSIGWMPLLLDFTSGPKTELIAVGVTRFPSQKFDNLIAGKVWVDDLSLTTGTGEATRTQESRGLNTALHGFARRNLVLSVTLSIHCGTGSPP